MRQPENTKSGLPRHEITGIIPAAGEGTRLHCSHGKLRCEILGRPLIDWAVSLLAPYSERIIIVTQEKAQFPDSFLRLYPNNHLEILYQRDPLGTADTVKFACNSVSSQYCIVHWVDQVTILPDTLINTFRFCSRNPDCSLALPTADVPNPYVHFVTNEYGQLVRVLQAREGDRMPVIGRKDLGSFVFRTDALRAIINTPHIFSLAKGLITREFNLLPLFPLFEYCGNGVEMLNIGSQDQSQDVNTPDDIITVTKILRGRQR
jgi:bifunctional N-acetylglucosamine-1-phosphate-uridyltransferase/glucosamine-1-phosphate-acetyltransferase GlmU-like protein